MSAVAAPLRPPLTALLLSLADDKFFLGCRNSDWTGLGPMLEEDIAFSALAQDDIAHAKELYEWLAQLNGGSADALAYGRPANEYRHAQLVELPDEFDWGFAIVRQFFCDHFDELRLRRLARSSHAGLAGLAERMLAEERLALGHADSWVVRLGRGTEESRARVQKALTTLAAPACELFEPTPGVDQLVAVGLYPALQHDMFQTWATKVEAVVEEARLHVQLTPPPADFTGGRQGRRTPAFASWLSEITEVYRVEPEAAW